MVSVIVPNYNHGKFLKQRLDSIFSQSYRELEVIILDDHSVDNSVDIINTYSNYPGFACVVVNEQNSGNVFQQWLKGIELAKGEYIWIAESDDYCDPGLLEELVSGLDGDPACNLAYCQSYCISGNDILWQSREEKLRQQIEGNQFIKTKMLHTNSVFNASMALWRRSIFEKMSQEFTAYSFCGDWLFWIELASTGKVFVSGKCLNYFRRDGGHHSATSAQGAKSLEEIRLFKNLSNRRIIDTATFNDAIQHSYLRFLESKKELVPETIYKLENEYRSEANNSFNTRMFSMRYSFRKKINFLLKLIRQMIA